jgi:hypothetical protein
MSALCSEFGFPVMIFCFFAVLRNLPRLDISLPRDPFPNSSYREVNVWVNT